MSVFAKTNRTTRSKALIIAAIFLFLFLASRTLADDDGAENEDEYEHEPAAQTGIIPNNEAVPLPVPSAPEPSIETPIQPPAETPPAVKQESPAISSRPAQDSGATDQAKPVSQPVPKTPDAGQADKVPPADMLADRDNDGVPDSQDKHPGEDDFAFLMADNNRNGIADELEAFLR